MEQQDLNGGYNVPRIIPDLQNHHFSDQCQNRENKGYSPRRGHPSILDDMLLNSIPIDCHHYQHQNLDVLPF